MKKSIFLASLAAVVMGFTACAPKNLPEQTVVPDSASIAHQDYKGEAKNAA